MTNTGEQRGLTSREKKLLRLLLASAESPADVELVEEIQVVPMDDGGMGSLYFMHPGKPRSQRRLGKCIAENQFTDDDGVLVSVALNVDQDGDLFELDLWKTDFSPVSDFPR